MYFNSTLEGTTVGTGASLDFSVVVPAVPVIVPAADTVPGPGSGTIEADRALADRWIGCDERSGVVEIHDPRLFRPGREAFCRALARSAIGRFHALHVEICLTTAMCRLEFRPGAYDRAELGRRVAEAVSAAIPSGRDRAGAPPVAQPGRMILTASAKDAGNAVRRRGDRPGRAVRPDSDPTPTPATRPPEAPEDKSRLDDLAMAGGALTMAVAGAILPGIPTLPFLLLAARHGVRVSPAMGRFLRRRPWTAALLDRAESSDGLLKLDRQSLPKLLAIVALAAAVLLIVHPPMPVVIALELALMAMFALREMGCLGGREVAVGVPA